MHAKVRGQRKCQVGRLDKEVCRYKVAGVEQGLLEVNRRGFRPAMDAG